MELTLDSPIRFVPHIGPVMASRLENLDITTVRDLLYHVPFRYDDFSLVSPITRVQPGETVTVNATVASFSNFFTKSGKNVQQAVVSDDTEKLTVIWFNQIYLRSVIKPGLSIHLSGKIDWFGNKIVMVSPQYEINTTLHTGRLVPVYPETEGVSSKWLRSRIAFLLEHIPLTDFLPEELKTKHRLISLTEAIHTVHFPQNRDSVVQGRRRIAFDEVFLLQLTAHKQKLAWQQMRKAKPIAAAHIPTLPFTLTHDQTAATREILSDMEKNIPMNRLLVGDVGSGKTVVAATAMYAVYKTGKKSILMAPTQILAHQHFQTISELLKPFAIKVGLVTAARKETGDVLIGTHALLSQKLDSVGLVVVDEQHRFGVEQRSLLRQGSGGPSNITPHLLTMTATPIPRTIAKTMLGNIDVSVISEMPKGRIPIKTWVVPPQKRSAAYDWIASQTGQVFIICPLIETSETLDVKAVKEEYEKIKKIFPQFRVGLLHGKLKPAEKTNVLDTFKNNEYKILVATPVVEVGIDIPNATIMVIEGADRFGLGQLHQLRGRVGRGSMQSYCLLFTDAVEEKTLQRLKVLETIHNGPALAEVDLTLRGPGEVFGTRQHGLPAGRQGMPHLKIASFTDMETLSEAQRAVSELSEQQLQELTKNIIIEELSKD